MHRDESCPQSLTELVIEVNPSVPDRSYTMCVRVRGPATACGPDDRCRDTIIYHYPQRWMDKCRTQPLSPFDLPEQFDMEAMHHSVYVGEGHSQNIKRCRPLLVNH